MSASEPSRNVPSWFSLPNTWDGFDVTRRIASSRVSPKLQELGNGRRQVEHGPVNIELVHVAGNRAGQQSLLQSLLGRVEGEAAGAVPDIEVDAGGDALEDLVMHTAVVVEDSAFPAPEAVGDHVTRLHQRQYLRHSGM